MVATGVMQAADGLKAAVAFSPYHARQPVEGCTDHIRRCFVNPGKYRRVAIVEKFELIALGMHHLVDMALRVEAADLFARGDTRLAGPDFAEQALHPRLLQEGALAVGPERMPF